MIKSLLMEYYSANKDNPRGNKPKRIIFFRDGVSKGQFQTARHLSHSVHVSVNITLRPLPAHARHQDLARLCCAEEGAHQQPNLKISTAPSLYVIRLLVLGQK